MTSLKEALVKAWRRHVKSYPDEQIPPGWLDEAADEYIKKLEAELTDMNLKGVFDHDEQAYETAWKAGYWAAVGRVIKFLRGEENKT